MILPGATTPSQSELGSNANEGLIRILQSSSNTGASSDCLIQDTHWGGVLPFCTDAVDVFYNPSQLGIH